MNKRPELTPLQKAEIPSNWTPHRVFPLSVYLLFKIILIKKAELEIHLIILTKQNLFPTLDVNGVLMEEMVAMST